MGFPHCVEAVGTFQGHRQAAALRPPRSQPCQITYTAKSQNTYCTSASSPTIRHPPFVTHMPYHHHYHTFEHTSASSPTLR